MVARPGCPEEVIPRTSVEIPRLSFSTKFMVVKETPPPTNSPSSCKKIPS